MKKSEFINLFGSIADVANALGVVSSAVSHWPEDLPNKTACTLMGAAIQNNLDIPPGMLKRFRAGKLNRWK
jgi:transcriptional regulator with XRE-family HTH domain